MQVLATGKIQATVNDTKLKELGMELRLQDEPRRLVLQFTGGPTGSEAYRVEDLTDSIHGLEAKALDTFCICAGGMGWDKCVVPSADVVKFLKESLPAEGETRFYPLADRLFEGEEMDYLNSKIVPNQTHYADRLWQRDHEKYDTLARRHFGVPAQVWFGYSGEKIEGFLREYFNKPELRLHRVSHTTSPFTGHYYFRADVYVPMPEGPKVSVGLRPQLEK